MRRKNVVLVWSVALLIALLSGTAEATSYDLTTILGNSGFEDDLVHSQWTATLPNTTSGWTLTVPVNPVIDPNGTLAPPCCVTAPAGSNFVGIKNPGSPAQDVKGKLAHDAETFAAIAGDIFQVTVFANRGRLDNQNTFPGSTPSLQVRFLGWNGGVLPTVNAATDNWSRSITFTGASMSFTNWGALGDWTSQTFSWTTPANLAYVSLTISGQNTNHDQYVAFDIATPVPEPATMFLGGLGLIAFGYAARKRLFRR